jgi:hypothetical protein
VVPVLPFLVLAAIPALLRLPRAISYAIVAVSVLLNWGLAMGRVQEQESSIFETLTRVYLGGFQLPALGTLSRMSTQYVSGALQVSSGLVFAVMAIVLFAVWRVDRPWKPLVDKHSGPGTAGAT